MAEKIEDLQAHGLKIYQRTDLYRFTCDAVFLSDFCEIKKSETVIDFGTGSAIIPILLSGKKQFKKAVGVEIQKELADMARKSVELNSLNDKIEILDCKIQLAHKKFSKKFDVAVCNPPYRKLGDGEVSKKTSDEIAKFEVEVSLQDIVEAARRNLKQGGRFYLVHRADRLTEIITQLNRNDLSPRKIRFIHAKANSLAHLVLIESLSGGNCQVKLLPPLVLKNDDNTETEEVKRIYGRSCE